MLVQITFRADSFAARITLHLARHSAQPVVRIPRYPTTTNTIRPSDLGNAAARLNRLCTFHFAVPDYRLAENWQGPQDYAAKGATRTTCVDSSTGIGTSVAAYWQFDFRIHKQTWTFPCPPRPLEIQLDPHHLQQRTNDRPIDR